MNLLRLFPALLGLLFLMPLTGCPTEPGGGDDDDSADDDDATADDDDVTADDDDATADDDDATADDDDATADDDDASADDDDDDATADDDDATADDDDSADDDDATADDDDSADDDDATADDDDATADDDDATADDDDATADDDDATADDDDATADDDDATADDDDATADDDDATADDDDATADDDDATADDDDATADDDDATTSDPFASGDLVITEFLKNPGNDDELHEWVEVYNPTGSDIDLDGWTIQDHGTDSHTISGSVIAPTGGYVVLGETTDAGLNGGVAVAYAYGNTGLTLGNGTDEIELLSPLGTVIDLVIYNDVDFPDSVGVAAQLHPATLNATDNNLGVNWCDSGAAPWAPDSDRGTPGADNTDCDCADGDLDGICDVLDLCFGDNATGDADGDGVCDDSDQCENFDDSIDGDSDGLPDDCDSCPTNAANTCAFFCINPYADTVLQVDVEALTVSVPLTMTLDGGAVSGMNAAVFHPFTGVIYAIVDDGVDRHLATLGDPSTFDFASIAPLSQKISSLAFDELGILYGVSGDGSAPSEVLYEVDLATAALTLITALGNGNDGEVIAFNPLDGLLYHWSGRASGIYETIDPATGLVGTLLTSTVLDEEISAAAFDPSVDEFLTVDIDDELVHYAADGTQTALGPLPATDLAGGDVQCRSILFIP